jgi:uncharacterized protein
MTPVLVDTSALYAVLDADDVNHDAAAAGWRLLLDQLDRDECQPITHSSVIVEITALVQRRLGMAAVRHLHDNFLELLTTVWVDAELNQRAMTALLAANRRTVSLVDWTSFEVMRMRSIDDVFAFDDDFVDQGFTRWPTTNAIE